MGGRCFGASEQSDSMLRCPACGDTNPEDLSLGITLGGYFASDLLAGRAALPAIKEYVLDTLGQEQSSLECQACGYRGPRERSSTPESDSDPTREP